MRLAAADSFNAVARISKAMTNSARLLAAPSETRIAEAVMRADAVEWAELAKSCADIRVH